MLNQEEKKLQKLMKKLDKVSKKYLDQLTEIDEQLRELSIRTSLTYNLERDYFDKMPGIIRSVMHLEITSGAILGILKDDSEIKD